MSDNDKFSAIISAHRIVEGPLLPILLDVQSAFGCVSEAHVGAIAAALNLSVAEVSGVVGFYHDLSRVPREKPVLKLCRAEACQARGGEALATYAELRASGQVLVEPVYCLGVCGVGPAAITGGVIHARLDEKAVDRLIEAAA